MKATSPNIQLNLTEDERKMLRHKKIKKADILKFAPDELEVALDISYQRAREINALAQFQQIPSIGIKFAEDLIFLGYKTLESLKGKYGPELLNDYERKKGFQTDPCVEDQFWLAVDYANNRNNGKNWWDFTKDRKKYRAENGYPEDRPEPKWFEILG